MQALPTKVMPTLQTAPTLSTQQYQHRSIHKMPTKAELEAKIESLNEDLRRQQRAINQLNIDLDDLPPVALTNLLHHMQTSMQGKQSTERTKNGNL